MGRPKGSKDKGKRTRRFYRKPEVKPVDEPAKVLTEPSYPPAEGEAKTTEPVVALAGAKTETPVQ